MAYARSRSRGDLFVHNPATTWYSNGVPAGTNGTGNILFPKNVAWIDDVVGNKGGINPVMHYEIQSFTKMTFVPFTHFGTTIFQNLDLCFPMLPGELWWNWPWIPEISPATLSEWSINAYNEFYDQVPPKMNLGSFLYELKDIKKLVPKFAKKEGLKNVSGNFLGYEFGIAPTVRDVQSILDLSSQVEKRLKHLRETWGKSTDLSYVRKLDDTSPYSFTRSTDAPVPSNGWDVRFKRLSYQGTFRVKGKLRNNLEGLNDSLAELKTLIAVTGLNNPAAIVWEEIPYSFVVDWFFNVGKYVDRLQVQPFGGEYTVSKVMHSVTESALFGVWQEYFLNEGNVPTLLGTVKVTRYFRKLGFPVSSLFAFNPTLNQKQLMLSTALLHQRH